MTTKFTKLAESEYVAYGVDLYPTALYAYSDSDYELEQAAFPDGSATTERVYLNKQQAIDYAKAILRNEGIHAID